MKKIKLFPILLIILTAISGKAFTQQPVQKKVTIVDKKNTINSGNDQPKTDSTGTDENDYRQKGSGIMITRNNDGILFKSHLRNYDNVKIELWNPEGEIIYEYSNKMTRNVDYTISLANLPAGRYIFNFIYENKLVVCNIHVGDHLSEN